MELYFSKEAVQMNQQEYEDLLTELAIIVGGMPDLPYDKLKEFSAICANFMMDIEPKDAAHTDLKNVLKVAAAGFIYTIQITNTLVATMTELDALKKGEAVPEPKILTNLH